MSAKTSPRLSANAAALSWATSLRTYEDIGSRQQNGQFATAFRTGPFMGRKPFQQPTSPHKRFALDGDRNLRKSAWRDDGGRN